MYLTPVEGKEERRTFLSFSAFKPLRNSCKVEIKVTNPTGNIPVIPSNYHGVSSDSGMKKSVTKSGIHLPFVRKTRISFLQQRISDAEPRVTDHTGFSFCGSV